MIKKIVFAGCSISAGTELYEEKVFLDYATMDILQTKKIKYSTPEKEIRDYNKKFSYPAIIGNLLNIEIENISVRGISNKEIAMRTIQQFPEKNYIGTVAIMQITTHNRMLLNYANGLVNSAVIQPTWPTYFLNSTQNNILQEFFLEFFNESLTMIEDYMSILYAIRLLQSKNVPCYVLKISLNKLNQPLLEPHIAGQDRSLSINDQSPLSLDSVQLSLINDFNKFRLTEKSLEEISNADYLPQWHFSQKANDLIANHLAEKIQCLPS